MQIVTSLRSRNLVIYSFRRSYTDANGCSGALTALASATGMKPTELKLNFLPNFLFSLDILPRYSHKTLASKIGSYLYQNCSFLFWPFPAEAFPFLLFFSLLRSSFFPPLSPLKDKCCFHVKIHIYGYIYVSYIFFDSDLKICLYTTSLPILGSTVDGFYCTNQCGRLRLNARIFRKQ